eukprot:3473861-Prymnesium_polylepis.2
MTASKLSVSGSTPQRRISSSSDSARSHCPRAFSHVEMAALKLSRRQRLLPLSALLTRGNGRVEGRYHGRILTALAHLVEQSASSVPVTHSAVRADAHGILPGAAWRQGVDEPRDVV